MFVGHFTLMVLICKNIDWDISSAVALHEDSVTETGQEHVGMCMSEVPFSACFFL
jgi:hypothetical protein